MIKVAYILSASHSGSTLLAMVLGAQNGLFTAGELKGGNLEPVEKYRCSCGKPILQCTFWLNVSASMQKRGVPFYVNHFGTNIAETGNSYIQHLLAPLYRKPPFEWARDWALSLSPEWHRHRREVQQRNTALFQTLAQQSGAACIVDSSKTGIRLKYLLRNPNLDIHAIRLIRDGRAVALTYIDPIIYADSKNPRFRAGGYGGVREKEKKNIADAAWEWRRSNEEGDALIAHMNPSRVYRVNYEQFCENPVNIIRNICRFLGQPANHVRMEFRNAGQHVIGNGMRLDDSSEIVLDDRWKTCLPNYERDVFERIAGDVNRKYGYE
jgi:hypothetical protein